jgi:NTP pyrophosphatase (non-canonical NTP hydrolase)
MNIPWRFNFEKHRHLKWLHDVFESKTNDPEERMLRFLEEVLELAQAEGVTPSQCYRLVYQVFVKPVGIKEQELGGVLNTLAAYLAVTGLDANKAYELELNRCEQPEIIERIRKKHREKLVVSSKSRG